MMGEGGQRKGNHPSITEGKKRTLPLNHILPGGSGDLVAKSCPTLATPWTIAFQAPLSIGFSRQEYWSGLPFPLPGDRLNPGFEPVSLTSPALTGGFFITSATWVGSYARL